MYGLYWFIRENLITVKLMIYGYSNLWNSPYICGFGPDVFTLVDTFPSQHACMGKVKSFGIPYKVGPPR